MRASSRSRSRRSAIAGTGNRMFTTAARQTTTDKQGAFELRGLTRTKLQARAESDAAASTIVDDRPDDVEAKTDVKLVLDVTGTIAGIVVDDTGAPVPEVMVKRSPTSSAGGSLDQLALAGMSTTTTDGGGTFVIRGLPEAA